MKKDLTTINTTYSYYLENAATEISELYEQLSEEILFKIKTIEESSNLFRNEVLKIIAPAKDTKAKLTFISVLNRMNNIDNMIIYVANANLKGAGLGVF